MKVHLVRHAKAEKRGRWDGPEPLRPLTLLGLRQARGIGRQLGEAGVERILTSPYLRCRQTVEPLAKATGLPVEIHECLAKGERSAKALELLRGAGVGSLVCCTHAELIDDLAAGLQEAGLEAARPLREPDPAGDGESQRLGVLDMGSTSFHLLVADVTRAGHLGIVGRERHMLRLGAAIATRSHIPRDVFRRAVADAAALRADAEALGAERLIAVGTAALRDADNGSDLTARIAEALRVPVRILSGEEEARLIFGAFRRRVLMPSGATLGVDLGGGSLELVVGDRHGVPHYETTLQLGVTRLHGELVSSDPIKKRQAREICQRVTAVVEPVAGAIERQRPALCILAGGTARALGDLAVALRGLRPARSVNELVLPLDELRQLCELLVCSSHEERLRLPGIRRRRADLLPTGALILVTLAELLGQDGYTLCDWGLREGVLLDAVGD